MKISNFAILFVSVFICFFVILSFNIDTTTVATQATTEYKNMLITACHDAMSDISSANINNPVFEHPSSRNRTIRTFKKSLQMNFNTIVDANATELISLYIPVICLVDLNGFYIYYNDFYKDILGDTLYDTIETPIHTWSERYAQYICQFYLGEKLSVLNIDTGEIDTDTYYNIYQKYGIDFCKDYETFLLERDRIIISEINNAIEYYINYYNTIMVKDYSYEYTFTIPQVKGEDWAKLVTGPSIMAFLQAKPLSTNKTSINLYSLSGSELVRETSCIVSYLPDGRIYYHKYGCTSITEDSYVSNVINAVAAGAEACPDCR